MTSPAVDNTMNFLRMNWPLIIVVCSGLIAWGVTTTKVQALEDEAEIRQEDHDAIIRIEAELSAQKTALKEARDDIKALNTKIDTNLTTILSEIRRSRPVAEPTTQ